MYLGLHLQIYVEFFFLHTYINYEFMILRKFIFYRVIGAFYIQKKNTNFTKF